MRSRVQFILLAVAGLGLATRVQATVAWIDDFSDGLGNWTTSATAGTVSWDSVNKWVSITSDPHTHANLYRFGAAADAFAVQADINDVSDGGYTWGPSLTLYYDSGNWAQMTMVADGSLEAEYYKNGGQQDGIFSLPSAWSADTWYTMRIELEQSTHTIEFLFGPQGGPLALEWSSPYLPTTFNGNGYLILGKGFSGAGYNTNPFLENDAATGGTQGVSLYDNAQFEISIPEPVTLTLLVGGGLLLAWSRRRC